MKEIHLKLTVDEINIIFEALGDQPFSKVFELIGKINDQANGQLDDSDNDNEVKINK